MQQRPIFKQYLYKGTGYVYAGAKRDRRGHGTIVTSGSTTTITSVNRAFEDAAVGDEIRVIINKVTYRRYIRTWTNAGSVVVDAAINIPVAQTWHHLPQRSGTADTDGWINVQHLKDKVLYIQMDATASGAGISYSLEGKGDGSNTVPRQLATGTLTAAVVAGTTNPLAADTVVIAELLSAIRVGVKNDNADVDKVSAWVTGETAR